MTPPTKGNVLAVENLQLAYTGRGQTIHAVQDANLIVREGEAVGIAGESGSGKSTLARAVMGLLPERSAQVISGRIVVGEQDVTRYTQQQWQEMRGNPIAIVFQDPLSFLNPVLRIGKQIAESVARHDPGAETTARSLELLDLVRLPATALHRYPHELSGGMRQRVMLAIALGCKPRLLVADEPTTALDVTTQAEILTLLRELQTNLGMALLLISHDLGILRWNSDRAYIMYAGHTIETGRTEDVLARPAHPYTRGLVEASRLHRDRDGHFATIGGDVPPLQEQFRLCPFLARCRSTVTACREHMPPKLHDQPDTSHHARCWHSGERKLRRSSIHAHS